MKLDDINLNDDKAAPQLDLDFGLADTATTDKKSGGFSFGGSWGGGWGSTGASWAFSGADNKDDKVVDDSGCKYIGTNPTALNPARCPHSILWRTIQGVAAESQDKCLEPGRQA